MNICLGWVVQLFRCVIFFCFITYHATSCMATSVNRRILFFGSSGMFQDWVVSSLQLFRSVKMAYKTPCIYHVLYYAPCCMSMMCTLFLKIEYTLSLTQIFITNLTTCNTLCNNNYAGDFQGRDPFVVTSLLCLYSSFECR
jgi:hypothetical protein